jgi:hypothetical protein
MIIVYNIYAFVKNSSRKGSSVGEKLGTAVSAVPQHTCGGAGGVVVAPTHSRPLHYMGVSYV